MTTTQVVLAVLALLVPIMAMFVMVLKAVRDDSLATGKLSAEVAAMSLRDQGVSSAIKEFQDSVDGLKIEFANIRNMWAGERKLVAEIQQLRVDLERLRAQHDQNHPPRTSQGVVMQEAAPFNSWGEDDGIRDGRDDSRDDGRSGGDRGGRR